MKTLWIDRSIAYDGSQLRSLYAYLEHRVLGDSIIAFEGPCDVAFEHMIDGEDLLERSAIRGGRMLHFLVEKFHASLLAGVALQRLLAALALDVLREAARSDVARSEMRREGDDVFWREAKFSVSIATVSPISTLIHFAVNVTNAGTPVATCSLVDDFGLTAPAFAEALLARFADEVRSIDEATTKVRCAP